MAGLVSTDLVPEVAARVARTGAERGVAVDVEGERAVAVRVRDAEHTGADRDECELAGWAAGTGRDHVVLPNGNVATGAMLRVQPEEAWT